MSIATMNDSIPRFRGFPVSLPSVSWFLERLPIVVLILSITFLQGYALSFWDGLLGRAGLGVSIGLEVLHIWFWYKSAISAHFARLSWIMLATVATGLLLAGALHEVSKPLLLDSARIETVAQQRKSLEAETRVLNANLAAFRDMAATQGRRGWRRDIRRDTARLQAITENLQKITNQSGKLGRRPWLNQATQGGVVSVAVLFQIAAVLAVWSLSGGSRKAERPFRVESAKYRNNGNVSPLVSETVGTFRNSSKQPNPEFYRRLWSQIESHAQRNSTRLAGGNGKCSQAALARDMGINPPDLSAIKLISQGRQVPRNPSKEAIVKLAKRFDIGMPK